MRREAAPRFSASEPQYYLCQAALAPEGLVGPPPGLVVGGSPRSRLRQSTEIAHRLEVTRTCDTRGLLCTSGSAPWGVLGRRYLAPGLASSSWPDCRSPLDNRPQPHPRGGPSSRVV